MVKRNRSRLNWTEKKWNKLIVALDSAIVLTKGHEQLEVVEDFLDCMMLVKRRSEKQFHWDYPQNTRCNSFYDFIKLEAAFVDNHTDLKLSACFKGWWN